MIVTFILSSPNPLYPNEGRFERVYSRNVRTIVRMRQRYLTELARANRRSSTEAERILWEALRNRKLEGARFVRQRVLGRYIADFYCPAASVVIEIDGAVHDTEEARDYDHIRTEELEARGLRVVRFRNEQVLETLPDVLKAIAEIARR
jgi:very-short-patch-repair endonuclease